MASRTARFLFLSLLVLLAASPWAGPAGAVETRRIVTTENADYFGFDLRSEQNVTLDQCKADCLGDPACRAFTYNTKAKWCFLKSDFNTLKPFSGAVAGKAMPVEGEKDIGAPPELAFFPAWMADQARQYRTHLTAHLRAILRRALEDRRGLFPVRDRGRQGAQRRRGRRQADLRGRAGARPPL